jgi:type II secretory pathway component PulF
MCYKENPDDVKRCSCLYRFEKDDTAPLINGESPLENERKINEKKKIKGQYFTAITGIIVIFGYLFLEALYIVPPTRSIYKTFGKELTSRAKIALNVSDFISDHLVSSILGSLLLLSGLIWVTGFLKINKKELLKPLLSALFLILLIEISIFFGAHMNMFMFQK